MKRSVFSLSFESAIVWNGLLRSNGLTGKTPFCCRRSKKFGVLEKTTYGLVPLLSLFERPRRSLDRITAERTSKVSFELAVCETFTRSDCRRAPVLGMIPPSYLCSTEPK